MDPDDLNALSAMIDSLRDSITDSAINLDQELALMIEELRTANLLALLPHLDDQARASTVTTVRRRLENA